ncbi:hypothetical protein FRP1_13325 [Pseudonocardia sp. EC080625-04]|nr:hypothetical protein FRP1_13325 [Pseudonocardia sp. EC080625-04]
MHGGACRRDRPAVGVADDEVQQPTGQAWIGRRRAAQVGEPVAVDEDVLEVAGVGVGHHPDLQPGRG